MSYVYRENSQDSTRHCQVSATWPLGYGLLHTWETKDRRKLDGLFSLLVHKLLEGVHCCLITRLHTCKEKKEFPHPNHPLPSCTQKQSIIYICICAYLMLIYRISIARHMFVRYLYIYQFFNGNESNNRA